MIAVRTADELKRLRKAGAVVAKTLAMLKKKVRPGITTGELDAAAEQFIRKSGARPAFLGYRGYPATICASINEEVVHGIPSGRIVRDGDILSIDVGVELNGYFSDAAITVPVRTVAAEAARLIAVTREALAQGIAQARAGGQVGDISAAVQACVEAAGFSVVREFVGHGIGAQLHEEPQIPNFGVPGQGAVLQPGMVLAIEPMVNAGVWRVEILADGWTAVTKDRALSAHFEHTVAVTDSDPEILTRE
ncbi:MAG: type I methionyl aminopeptidase [Candidatus Omnitrophica bacterium]|nr:type I methionyl aminopeptidase [Candidatus Omnitrophota bacterium]